MACKLTGVALRIDDISTKSEEEMQSMVRALNEHRRANTTPLTEKEKRALIIEELSANPERSDREIAKKTGVSHPTVGKVRSNGNNYHNSRQTSKRELIVAALQANPKISSSELSVKFGCAHRYVNHIRKGIGIVDKTKASDGHRLLSIKKPAGVLLSELIKRGIEIEKTTDRPEIRTIARQVGLDQKPYRLGREIVLIAQRGDLSAAHAAIAKKALALMDSEQNPRAAHDLIDPIARRIWGDRQKARSRDRNESQRLEKFQRVILLICETCSNGENIELPYLAPDDTAAAVRDLKDAAAALQKLTKRLMEAAR